MIEPSEFCHILEENGITLYTGVPDSLLIDLSDYLGENPENRRHIIAANEGNAVAIATGYFISTGNPSLVYMQNSGLGNAINPLASLAHKSIHRIPMLLLVGHRGEPGQKDEPQHLKQGEITSTLAEILDIPCFRLHAASNSREIILEALRLMNEQKMPVMILVGKGVFSQVGERERFQNLVGLKRPEVIETILKLIDKDMIIVTTTGKISREVDISLRKLGMSEIDHFLMVGSMGHASSIALGLALGLPERRVICLDGDGAALMHLGSWAINGQAEITNFYHILINNGSHESVGGQPTVALKIDMTKIASACGYQIVDPVDSIEELKKSILFIRGERGPYFLEIRTTRTNDIGIGRPSESPQERMDVLMSSIRRD